MDIKQKIKEIITSYLISRKIKFRFLNESGKEPTFLRNPIPLEALSALYLCYRTDVPGGIIESDLYLFDEKMIVRAYYSAEVAELCKNSDKKRVSALLRVINFINGSLLISNYNIPYLPYIYVGTDGRGDIAIKTCIDYRFLELLPEETLDFITIFFPQIMEELAYPIIGVIAGKLSSAMAIHYIKQEIMEDDDPIIEFGGDE